MPRWAIGIHWRRDGKPVWKNPERIASDTSPATATIKDAQQFAHTIADALGVARDLVIDAYEDPLLLLSTEARLPINIDPLTVPFKHAEAHTAAACAGTRRRYPRRICAATQSQRR